MCGIVGMLSTTKKDVGVYIYDALTIIQHRGQDAAGITTASKGRFYMRKGNGMVRNVFRTKHITKLIFLWIHFLTQVVPLILRAYGWGYQYLF